MNFLRRSLVGLFLVSVTVGLLAWAASTVFNAIDARMSKEQGQRPSRERVFAVNVTPLVPTSVTPVLTAFGEVGSRRTLDIRASVGGRVVEMAESFENGGRVSAGQLLLRVDPLDAQSALDKTRADLHEAEAELRDAIRALDLARDEVASAKAQAALRSQALARQNNLLKRGVGTEAAVETAALAEASAKQAVLSRRQAEAQAEARIDQANTSLARQRIVLAEAERRLADTEIYAGFAGTLADVAVVEGGLVTANERLAQLIDADALEVSFRVSTSQYARLLDAEGRLARAPITIQLDVFGTNLETTGVITRESAAVGEGQTGRLLFARLEQAKGFRPGDFVTVNVKEPMLTSVVLVPSSAVDAAGTVLVLIDDDRLEQAEVQVLRRQGDNVIIRAPGLSGREIVAERSPLLGAGIKVRPIRESGAEAAAEPEMLELSEERRAKLIAFIEANDRMPQEAKDRVLGQLAEEKVPAQVVARIEQRMGG